MAKHLYIVRGLPGSGKSTFCNRHFSGVYHLENDQFLMRNGEYKYTKELQKSAIEWCIASADIAMRFGMDLCVSNTFVKNAHMELLFDLARTHGYEVEVYRMTSAWGNVHCVPDAILEDMEYSFEDFKGERLVDFSATENRYVIW